MITLDQVHKTYKSDGGVIQAVAPTSLHIERGEIFGIIGPSGAGKSTLLRLINGSEQPDGGRIYVDRQETTALARAELSAARRSIGAIGQHLELAHNRTALSNIAFPLEIAGVPTLEAQLRAAECLAWVGLADKAVAYPAQLSDAERQRVAIGRALAPSSSILWWDEPTSALDPRAFEGIVSTMQAVNRDRGITVLIVTRSAEVVRRLCHAVAIMENGHVVEQIRLGDLLAAPRSELGRQLFAPRDTVGCRARNRAERTSQSHERLPCIDRPEPRGLLAAGLSETTR
jgi:D-methionine transport system ATP-binding protein